MWFYKPRFKRGLMHQSRHMDVIREVENHELDSSMASIDIDYQGFYAVDEFRLGELAALVLGQAQCDGASRIQVYYGNNRMVYTIGGTDYDMVPCPPPMNVDLVRCIAKMSGLKWDVSGLLSVRFSDCTLTLTATHHMHAENPYVEIAGFTGEPYVTLPKTVAV